VLAVVMYASAGSGGTAANDLAELFVMLDMLPKMLVTACATALFAFTSCVSMAVSTAVSREGKRHEFYRTLPVRPGTQLMAKLTMGITLNVITSLPIAAITFVMLPVLRWQIAAGFLCALLFSTATSAAALMMDAAHPKFGWKSETEAIKQNTMAAISMFGGMAALALCGVAYYGLTVLGASYALAMFLLCAIALTADVLMLFRLTGKTAQTYILQEVQN